MLDHALESAFCAALGAAPELADLHFFTGQTEDSRELPALTIISKSESLSGFATVFRAEVQIVLESHAHDTPTEQHATFLIGLQSAFADKPALLVAVNATGHIYLFGYSLSTSEPEAIDGKFRTVVVLKVGYKALAH